MSYHCLFVFQSVCHGALYLCKETIMKKVMNLKKEQGGMYGGVWKEEGKEENDAIIISKYKRNNF